MVTAPGAATPAATSPGRLAFEAWAEAEGRLTEWHEDLDDHARAAWEFAAQAAIAAAAPRCPSGCGCRLGTEDADARECGCDGICRYSFDEMTEILREGDRLHEENGNLRDEHDSLTGRVAELVTEGNELRAKLAAAEYFAETWRELLGEMPDDYDCHMTCAEANAAADLYRALGDESSADYLLDSHANYDEEDDQHYERMHKASGSPDGGGGRDARE